MTQPAGADRGMLPIPEAARLLAHLGFEVVHGDRPGETGGANLLVGLRATPTLEHFDPERVTYWVARGGRGRVAELSRETSLPVDGAYSWGTLRVIDRLEEMNTFMTFGGRLRVEALGPTLSIAVFASPGPIVRWSGHSQPIDALTGYVGAFFARLMIPIDFTPGAETLVATAPVLTLYAAFLADLQARFQAERQAEREVDVRAGEIARWAEREVTRLGTIAPGTLEQGLELLRGLALEPGA